MLRRLSHQRRYETADLSKARWRDCAFIGPKRCDGRARQFQLHRHGNVAATEIHAAVGERGVAARRFGRPDVHGEQIPTARRKRMRGDLRCVAAPGVRLDPAWAACLVDFVCAFREVLDGADAVDAF